MNPIFKEIIYKSPAWSSAVQLREKILRAPLGSYFTQEELEEEKNHFQIAGYIAETLVATAVLVPSEQGMKMQRVVVAEHLRSLNIGSAMMHYCETFAIAKSFQYIYCHARDTAVQFYLKNGYQGIGEYFDEDGIPHLKMMKSLLQSE